MYFFLDIQTKMYEITQLIWFICFVIIYITISSVPRPTFIPGWEQRPLNFWRFWTEPNWNRTRLLWICLEDDLHARTKWLCIQVDGNPKCITKNYACSGFWYWSLKSKKKHQQIMKFVMVFPNFSIKLGIVFKWKEMMLGDWNLFKTYWKLAVIFMCIWFLKLILIYVDLSTFSKNKTENVPKIKICWHLKKFMHNF